MAKSASKASLAKGAPTGLNLKFHQNGHQARECPQPRIPPKPCPSCGSLHRKSYCQTLAAAPVAYGSWPQGLLTGSFHIFLAWPLWNDSSWIPEASESLWNIWVTKFQVTLTVEGDKIPFLINIGATHSTLPSFQKLTSLASIITIMGINDKVSSSLKTLSVKCQLGQYASPHSFSVISICPVPSTGKIF